MNEIALGARIWFFTVLVTALGLAAGLVLFGEVQLWPDSLGVLVVGMVMGLILTSPLIFPTIWLVGIMPRLPYSFSIAVAWLWGMLALLVVVFYLVLAWIVGAWYFEFNILLFYLIGITFLALLIIFRLSLKSLREYNTSVQQECA